MDKHKVHKIICFDTPTDIENKINYPLNKVIQRYKNIVPMRKRKPEYDEDEGNIVQAFKSNVGKANIKTEDYKLNMASRIIMHNNSIKLTKMNDKIYCTKEHPNIGSQKVELNIIIKKGSEKKDGSENIINTQEYKRQRTMRPLGHCSTNIKINNFQHVQKIKTLNININKPVATAVVKNTNSVSCQTVKQSLLSIIDIRYNEKAIEFYTGLQNYAKVVYVFKTLCPDAYDLRYYYNDHCIRLTPLDQFFMTLILLRQHKSHYEISILFDVSLKDIKNVFITWIRFMKLEWSSKKFQLSNFSIDMQKNYKINLRLYKEKNYNVEYKVDDNMVIDLENDDSDSGKSNFKKMYKILNGPQNYIESHLMNDIIFVCHTLCYFKVQTLKTNNQVKSG